MKFCALALAFGLLWAGPSPHRRAPVDAESLNRFAAQYNRYMVGMNSGINDFKQWDRVEAAWKAVR